jgi:hypothetical protein
MTDSTLIFTDDGAAGTRVVVNFGIHGGREATQAELERLGEALVAHVEAVDVVSENRYRFDGERGAAVHQVLIEATASAPDGRDAVVGAAAAWAKGRLRAPPLAQP